ncbi:MAG TPA: hypothetical protein VJV78_21180 [Polyangiales bacterium]|nr:hypothetical protein [Polyangiales bacterium]
MRRVLVTFSSLFCLFAACAPEGPSAYVSFALPVPADCKVTPDAESFLFVGEFDIAAGADYDGARKSKACQNSYYLHLLVNSNLKSNAREATGRAEPNVLQISEAEVELIDIEQQATIPFDAKADPLPNPFRVKVNNTLPPTDSNEPTTGVVAVETIPVGYDAQLRDYIGKQILAQVQIFGTTLGDIDIDFKPFSFPVHICEGCLTLCAGDIPDDTTPDEVYGDKCADNAGADGRVCVDYTCKAPM